MATLGRRTFLALAAALFAPVIARLRAVPRQAPTPAPPRAISLDEFVRLSQRLTVRTRLDAGVAATYLNALLAVPTNVPLLAELARGTAPSPAHTALERTIVEWWYTGAYTLNGEPRLATHTGALIWNALGMPAPGTCAGAFGAWSRPPRVRA